jgi:trimeric autotransporter adhesin
MKDMHVSPRVISTVSLAAVLFSAMAAAHCGGSMAAPSGTSTSTVSGVTLSASTVVAGSSGQGTIGLTAPALAGGAGVALSSSNPAVASVPATVTVPAGSSSMPFTITAVAAGTVTFTASTGGSSSQSAMLTVAAARSVGLLSIVLGQSSVVGGDSVTAIATLTGPAPAGGAAVTLSGGEAVTVPASVNVAAGASSATFTIQTRQVGGSIASTIGGAYGGASASAELTITGPGGATASFGVTGPTLTDTCALTNNGNAIDCTFNGSTSSSPGTIVAWDWTYNTIAATFSQTTTGAVLAQPAVNCSLLPAPPLPDGVTFLPLTVTLKVHDNLGNVSAVATNRGGARLFPNGTCGF